MKQQYSIRDSILRIDYDGELLAAVTKALGDMKSERFKVLRNAINATLRQYSPILVKKAQEEYTEKKAPLKKSMSTRKASTSKLEGTITVKGGTMELRNFKATAPKSGAKAKILQSSGLKAIQSQSGHKAKAFLATFASGHTAIVQRQEGQTYTRGAAKRREKYGAYADMTRIKKLLSVSFPKMMGGSAVMGELGPGIYETLLENVEKELQRVMRA